jgi:hypothetical protein
LLQEQESAAAGCFGIEPPHTPIASLSLRVVFSLSRGRINLRRFCIEVGTGWAPPTWDSYPACSLITNVTDCPVFVKLFFAIFCAACQAWRLFAIAIFPMSHESKENNEFSHCLPINYTYRAEHVLRGKNERLSAQKPALWLWPLESVYNASRSLEGSGFGGSRNRLAGSVGGRKEINTTVRRVRPIRFR